MHLCRISYWIQGLGVLQLFNQKFVISERADFDERSFPGLKKHSTDPDPPPITFDALLPDFGGDTEEAIVPLPDENLLDYVVLHTNPICMESLNCCNTC
jgi:hypothetical protein